MDFYKLLKVLVHRGGNIVYRIKYNHDIVHVQTVNGDFMVIEFGHSLEPLYYDDIIIGFTDAG